MPLFIDEKRRKAIMNDMMGKDVSKALEPFVVDFIAALKSEDIESLMNIINKLHLVLHGESIE